MFINITDDAQVEVPPDRDVLIEQGLSAPVRRSMAGIGKVTSGVV
jgi:hypothetical protein